MRCSALVALGVLLASQHRAGAEVDVMMVVETLPQTPPLVPTDARIERVGLFGHDQGRAPPISPA